MQHNKGFVSEMGFLVILILVVLFVWYLAGNTISASVSSTPNEGFFGTFTNFGSHVSPMPTGADNYSGADDTYVPR